MILPYITNKDEFLAAVAHKDEIGVNVRDGYTVVAYNVAFPDTFDSPEALECRGIIFDNVTGKVIRRPLHKFFNVNEKEHTQIGDLVNEGIVSVTTKLDGAMVAPFLCNGKIIWGTKRVAEEFERYLEHHPLTQTTGMKAFVAECIFAGLTPIFEFHDPNFIPSKIVVQYDRAFLRLIAVRDNKTGAYEHKKGSVFRKAVEYGVETVPHFAFGPSTTLVDIMKVVENMSNDEGVVVELVETGPVKIKSPWYVKRHKIKEMFNHPHITAQLVLDCHATASIDDIMPYIEESDRVYFGEFARDLHVLIDAVGAWAVATKAKFSTKKDFALSEYRAAAFSNIVFRLFDRPDEDVFLFVVDQLKNHLGKQSKFEDWKVKAGELV